MSALKKKQSIITLFPSPIFEDYFVARLWIECETSDDILSIDFLREDKQVRFTVMGRTSDFYVDSRKLLESISSLVKYGRFVARTQIVALNDVYNTAGGILQFTYRPDDLHIAMFRTTGDKKRNRPEWDIVVLGDRAATVLQSIASTVLACKA